MIKKYPALETENLYILNTNSKNDIEEMNLYLGKTLLVIGAIEEGAIQSFMNLPQGTDPFMVLKQLPREQIDALKIRMDEQFKTLPEGIITQSAITYIKSLYEEIGISIKRLQTNYILYIGGIMLLISLIGIGYP